MAATLEDALKYDDLHEATNKVKACSAALCALYLEQEAGFLRYEGELLEMLSHQLHEAAYYLDKVEAAL